MTPRTWLRELVGRVLPCDPVAFRSRRSRPLSWDSLESRVLLSGIVDDFPGTLSAAPSLALSATAIGSQAGVIEKSDDRDVFRFTAPVTGAVSVRQDVALGSALAGRLRVLDANGLAVASSTSLPGQASVARFQVTSGR